MILKSPILYRAVLGLFFAQMTFDTFFQFACVTERLQEFCFKTSKGRDLWR